MSDIQKEQIKKIVYTYARLANVNDENNCNDLINRLSAMNEEDIIDYLVVALSDLVEKGQLKEDDIFSNIDLITSLSEKYSSKESLIKRFNWLKSMNMTHPAMPLSENHKLVIEVFDSFSKLIGTSFDAYYVGGLMIYLATDHPLERYHHDIDIFFNEDQLERLFDLVNTSKDFTFINNMGSKSENGHEFKIQYKDTEINIGLFLFSRKDDNSIIYKEYNHKEKNLDKELTVIERHYTPLYTSLLLDERIHYHNGIPFRMQSLEAMYNAKKNSRPKDIYDACIIKDRINLMIDYQLDIQKHNNYEVKKDNVNDSIVALMENKINCLEVVKNG